MRVTAPDQLGLLSAVYRWFADAGVSIEAANVTTVDGIAKDIFLIDGKCDIDDLERQLSGRPLANCNPIARVNAILRRLGFG